jgi:predicted GIY-YIG superfamily endonuclease
MSSKEGIIYLIHFDTKLHHAQHYLGFCKDGNLEKRIERHMSGDGSKLMRAVMENGITWRVVKTWVGTRTFERSLKNKKNSRCLCPACKEAA